MPGQRDGQVPVAIRLGRDFPPDATSRLRSRSEAFAGRLGTLAASLGVTASVNVQIVESEGPAPLEVSVHGVTQPMGPSTVDRAWQAAAAAAEPTPDWSTLRDLPVGRAEDLVERVVSEVVSVDPECLVGIGQIVAFHAVQRRSGSGGRLSHARSARFLRELLRLGFAVAPHPPSWGAYDDPGDPAAPIEELVERFVCAGRPAGISLLVSPEDWSHLTGGDVVGPVLAQATHLGPSIARLGAALFLDLGVRFPPVWLVPSTLEPNTVMVHVNGPTGLPISAGTVPLSEAAMMVLDTEVRRRPERLLSANDVEFELSVLHERFPELVATSLARFPLVGLTRVLRALLREHVAIRDLRSILESLLALGLLRKDLLCPPATETDVSDAEGAADFVRCSELFRTTVTRPYVDTELHLQAVPLEPDLEGAALAAVDASATRILPEAVDTIGPLRAGILDARTAPLPLLASTVTTRRAVRTVLSGELGDIPVLARTEIDPVFSLNLDSN